jgi:alkylation response protein AidB-like acyl-CoA dehydrogenase
MMKPTEDDLERYRQHVRGVIAAHRPSQESREGHRAPVDAESEAELRHWYRTLYDEGILGGGWPVDRGGRANHNPHYDLITTEEVIRARVPRPIDQVQLASHVLISFGTAAQKDLYLPLIRSAAHIWCQLFSEPGAGSDLAGVRCSATPAGNGGFRLNGQKIWSTDAHWADMGLALIRTGPDRHQGLTAFLIPMDTPGVSVRPIRTIGGAYEFNEVFLDDVTLDASAVLGAIGGGWAVAMAGLESERFGVGANVVLLEMLLDDVATVARAVHINGHPGIRDDLIRSQLVDLASGADAAMAFVNGHIERESEGRADDSDGPIGKILYTETYNRIARFGVHLAAEHPIADSEEAKVSAERLRDAWLWSRALTISGGSSEIMRNIIARHRLHLPPKGSPAR